MLAEALSRGEAASPALACASARPTGLPDGPARHRRLQAHGRGNRRVHTPEAG
jgi:hypothetical protein